jgi:hypothetical protein
MNRGLIGCTGTAVVYLGFAGFPPYFSVLLYRFGGEYKEKMYRFTRTGRSLARGLKRSGSASPA